MRYALLQCLSVGIVLGLGCKHAAGGTGPNPAIVLSVNPTSATVAQGGSTTVTGTLTRSGGFTDAVTFVITGVPAGVTATAGNIQTSGTVTSVSITIQVGTTTAPTTGTPYSIVVTGKGSGVADAAASFSLTVTAADFSLAVSPNQVTLAQGANKNDIAVTLTRVSFTDAVTLSLVAGTSAVPAGVTAAFSPPAPTGTASTSTLTLTIGAAVTAGTYNLLISGTGALRTHTTPFTLIVTASGSSITTLLPSAIVSGSPGFLLSVIGTGFVAGSQVQWNGSTRATTFVSATQLTALVTAADIAANSTAQVTVLNPATGTSSPARPFSVDTPPQLSVGDSDVCGFKPGAQVFCWGSGYPLDQFLFQFRKLATPTPLGAGRIYRQISAAGSHVCGVTAAGVASCWGQNLQGQLGDGGSEELSETPVTVAGGLTWSMVAVGDRSCGLTTAGAVYCWGRTSYTTGDFSPVPVAIAAAPALFTVTVGANHACGLTSAGVAYCWGNQYQGALGDGSSGLSDQLSAVQVSGGHSFIAISAGGGHTCGLEANGAAWCWGGVETATGSLGNGGGLGDNGSLIPVPVSGGHVFQSISAGIDHSCAVDAAGMAWCWGEGGYGVLGQGVANSSNVPVAVSGGLVFRSIAAGGPTCGVITSGAVYCWGVRLALGSGSNGLSPVPVPVSGGLVFSDIAIAYRRTCGLTSAGATWCWGTQRNGGDPTSTDESTPKLVTGVPPFVALSEHEGLRVCGRTAAGAVYCLDATATLFPAPVPLVSVTDGGGNTCGRSTAGDLYCNGFVYFNGPQFSPQSIAFPGTSFSDVVEDSGVLCGILGSGTMQCIGNGIFGDLGNGSTASTTTLTTVSGGVHFQSVARGGVTTCGVAVGGSGYCWGEVGTNQFHVPTVVSGNPTFSSIEVSYFAICGILTSNQAVCWSAGDNLHLLGTTATPTPNIPQAVQGPAMSRIRVGLYHVCGLTPAGAAWCWGQQDVGELGNGVLGYVPAPTLVTW